MHSQILPLVGRLILVEANLTLCLDACPSVEVFVMHSGLGLGRPHSMPLVGGLYHAQQTLTRGPQDLPLVGGLCLA